MNLRAETRKPIALKSIPISRITDVFICKPNINTKFQVRELLPFSHFLSHLQIFAFLLYLPKAFFSFPLAKSNSLSTFSAFSLQPTYYSPSLYLLTSKPYDLPFIYRKYILSHFHPFMTSHVWWEALSLVSDKLCGNGNCKRFSAVWPVNKSICPRYRGGKLRTMQTGYRVIMSAPTALVGRGKVK